jgi:hypothetical protein
VGYFSFGRADHRFPIRRLRLFSIAREKQGVDSWTSNHLTRRVHHLFFINVFLFFFTLLFNVASSSLCNFFRIILVSFKVVISSTKIRSTKEERDGKRLRNQLI